MIKWTPREIQCLVCGKKFMSYHQATRMCSDECRKLRKKESASYVRTSHNHKKYWRINHPLRPCAICNKLLDSNRQVVHEECMEQVMMTEYPKFSKETRIYMNNHGYLKSDVMMMLEG